MQGRIVEAVLVDDSTHPPDDIGPVCGRLRLAIACARLSPTLNTATCGGAKTDRMR